MPFQSSHDANLRLSGNQSKLTPEEVRDLMPWMRTLGEAEMRRLNSELALQNLQAVQQFERSSSRLTLWLIILTVAILLLTAVLAIEPIQNLFRSNEPAPQEILL